jgi:hypothetical protein
LSREQYLAQVIRLYLQAPDTPRKARKADWAIATTFYRRGIPLADVEHAIYLASLRRHRRGQPLTHEPICSLAYFRPLLEQLQHQPHDPDYVDYIRWTYRRFFDEMAESAARRQNTALLNRR